MNILVQQPKESILEGITQTLFNIGYNVVIWNDNTPFNDLLDTHNPEIVFCYSNSITEQPQSTLEIKPKLILVGEYYGDLEPDLICLPDNTEKEKKERLSHLALADKYLYIKSAANVTHHSVKYDPKYATNIFYYSKNTTKEILDYLLEVEKDYQLKIIGPHKVPLTSYLGMGYIGDIVNFMQSAKIILAFDLPSLYTYKANRAFCLTNQSNDIYTNRSVINFNNIDELKKKINYYLSPNHKNHRKLLTEKAYEYIIAKHTYHHRLYDIFIQLRYTQQANQCMEVLHEYI